MIAADTSRLTGWGLEGANYHPQFRRFRGYAFMSSSDGTLLPWNTTKTGVDAADSVYLELQKAMANALARVQTAINYHKTESELIRDERLERSAIVEAFDATSTTDIEDLPHSQTFVFPARAIANPTPASEVNVQYRVPISRLNSAKQSLGISAAGRVGRATFDYYLRHEVDDA